MCGLLMIAKFLFAVKFLIANVALIIHMALLLVFMFVFVTISRHGYVTGLPWINRISTATIANTRRM
jgi:hypothetical protein